jgi:hypothetical protein
MGIKTPLPLRGISHLEDLLLSIETPLPLRGISPERGEGLCKYLNICNI